MPVPCNCCPIAGPTRCAPGEVPFSAVQISANPAGLPITNLASTIDGTAGADLSGFSPPVTEAQLVANPTTGFDYLFAAPVDNLVRLRWHNGGGGVLTDQDGFGLITVTLLDAGLAPLYTTPWDLTAPITNNAVVRELNFPPVSGVARVRFDGFHKQNVGVMGTGSPLLRQVEAFTNGPVFPCRRRNGTLEWYDEAGNLVPNSEVVSCDGPQPFILPDLHLVGAAFGDDPGGLGENLCNVVPAPSAFTGWTFNGTCYDPTTGAPTMDWAPTSSVVMEYDEPVGAQSGGVFMQFSSPTFGTITWPTNNTDMAVGDVRVSNAFGGGHRAVLTYLSGPAAGSAAGTIRMTGGANLGVHFGNVSNAAPIRFRLDFQTV
ncbi:hypothetical protein [Streptomyces sp. NRRL B-1347]|uniref:hypothetical protein n=1 Tax=Streptomyces sp. NRRL B-1347 TaxID=1476877 RepID=UPI0004C536F7|nr:hypothetical protein [Streptomyces sp. NRRL B-1347]